MQETKVSNSGTADSLLQVLDGYQKLRSMSSSERSGPLGKIGGQGVLEGLGCLFVIVQNFAQDSWSIYEKEVSPRHLPTCQVIDQPIFLGTRNPDVRE